MIAEPLQLAPPNAGAGLLHVRVYVMRPPPQYELVATHADQLDQTDQLPATYKPKNCYMCYLRSLHECLLVLTRTLSSPLNEKYSYKYSK